MKSDELIKHPDVKALLDECRKLREQRDELAAALAQITRATGANLSTGHKLDNINSIAHAALAKLEAK